MGLCCLQAPVVTKLWGISSCRWWPIVQANLDVVVWLHCYVHIRINAGTMVLLVMAKKLAHALVKSTLNNKQNGPPISPPQNQRKWLLHDVW